jgi:hypothetical protein
LVGTSNSNYTEEYNGTSWATGGDLNTARNELLGVTGTQTAALAFGGGSYRTATELYDGTSWTHLQRL